MLPHPPISPHVLAALLRSPCGLPGPDLMCGCFTLSVGGGRFSLVSCASPAPGLQVTHRLGTCLVSRCQQDQCEDQDEDV